jgi:hypothetical protein
LAASFDPVAIHEMAVVIGTEGRAKYNMAVRAGERKIFEGITFWSPNINIFRDPRWGRGQETYGEDPYLTSRMGVAFVTGLQGDDPKYLRVVSTPKHFAVHSGPESTRHTADVIVSKHDEEDTLLAGLQITAAGGMADKQHGAWRNGHRSALLLLHTPRRRLLELRNSCATRTHPTARKIGHSKHGSDDRSSYNGCIDRRGSHDSSQLGQLPA